MPKIKAVLDTNLFVSGLISSKDSPRKILELAKKEVFKVVTSVPINREILEVLHRDYIYVKYGLLRSANNMDIGYAYLQRDPSTGSG